MPKQAPPQTLTRIASLVGIGIGLAGVVFVARTLVIKWDEVSDAFAQVSPRNLVGSYLLGLAAMTSIGAIWVGMIQHKGHQVSHRFAMAWYFTGQLGKYVPGGIWPIVGRAELATRNGVARVDAYASTGLSLVTTYLAATVTLSIGAIFTVNRWPIAIAISVGLVFAYGIFSNQRLRFKVLSVLARFSSSAQALTEPRRLAILTAAHIPSWILMSLSTSVTASAFGAQVGIFEMMFITATSWFVGFVVVGVPGGIGVREAVFTSLATPIIGAPMAVSLSLLSRVVFIAVDLSGALFASLVATSARSTKV